jgi:hypothetical protein
MFRLPRLEWIFVVLLAFVGPQQRAVSQPADSLGVSQPTDNLGLNNHSRQHMGLNGQPCLLLKGFAKAQAVNKTIYEHWVRAANSCGQNIKVNVCYHDTDHCVTMNVPSWGQTQSLLGIFPALKTFRFDAKEQF